MGLKHLEGVGTVERDEIFSDDKRVNGSLPKTIDTSSALQGAKLNGFVESPKPELLLHFWCIMCDMMAASWGRSPRHSGLPGALDRGHKGNFWGVGEVQFLNLGTGVFTLQKCIEFSRLYILFQ